MLMETRSATIKGLMELAVAIVTASAERGNLSVAKPPQPAVKPLVTNTRERRMRGAPVDFHAVEPHQRAIDVRLRNWGRWCNGTSGSESSPMFRMVPPPPRVRGDGACYADTVDRKDAERIAEALAELPAPHRAAINWCYAKPVNPKRACEAIGTTMEGLAQFVRDGRQMLINRGK
jgi:hypothetical protein